MEPEDPYDLKRFVDAQEMSYQHAIAELHDGQKRTHWMWYVFPQFEGLGTSHTSKRFAIKSIEEANAYLAHPLLGPRLLECCEAIVELEGQSANEIFGIPDDLKLRSCVTLFAQVCSGGSIFQQVLDKYFDGKPDEQTLNLVGV
jgi:uncharacterized protein (DUF1810 family)